MRKTMALFAISLMVLLEGGAQASPRVLKKGDVTVPVPISAMGTKKDQLMRAASSISLNQ